jgi:hypothetical protein
MIRLQSVGPAIVSLAILLSATTAADAQARRPLAAASTIHFFIHGHEDDWAIFMSPAAHAAAQAGEPVVFIYGTAGDAGNPDPNYWQSREAAATAAQSVLSGQPLASSSWACAMQSVNNHQIQRCSYQNFTAYFMRGHDGSRNGCGYPQPPGGPSLTRLMGNCGTIMPMPTVDRSTTYTTWTDFWQTLGAIINQETSAYQASNVWTNAPDYNTANNQDDHPDHVAVGQAVKCALDGGGTNCSSPPGTPQIWNTRWYVGYGIMNMPKNATAAEFIIKSGMYMAYDREMFDLWDSKQNCSPAPCHSTMCSDYARYSDWLFRLYARTGP